MYKRRRIIYLVSFLVLALNAITLGSIYHVRYAYPMAGIVAAILGAVYTYLYLRKKHHSPTNYRRLIVRRAILLYLGFAIIASLNATVNGWHWFDLFYLVFPTAVSAILFYLNRRSERNTVLRQNSKHA